VGQQEVSVADDSPERAELVLTTTREGATVLIGVVGELDAHSAPSLEELAASLRADGCATFTLDMAGTSFIDSSGLRSLVTLHTALAEGGGGSLTLQAPSDSVVRLLSITGLAEHFSVT
jgi:anti-anti-sigma factor